MTYQHWLDHSGRPYGFIMSPASIAIARENEEILYIIFDNRVTSMDTDIFRLSIAPNIEDYPPSVVFRVNSLVDAAEIIRNFIIEKEVEFWGERCSFTNLLLLSIFGDPLYVPKNFPNNIRDINDLGLKTPNDTPINAAYRAQAIMKVHNEYKQSDLF